VCEGVRRGLLGVGMDVEVEVVLHALTRGSVFSW
jgi:hypothetical protein